MEIKRLGAEHYDDLINLLNVVFSRKNGRDMDFEKEIPKMCVRDDEHMGKHLGIYEGDRLAAAMGVYPFDTVVAGQELTFATTGNIAVHWDFEGRAPIYSALPFSLRLRGEKTVEFTSDIDVRKWLPGDTIEHIEMTLPKDLPCGTYALEFRLGGSGSPIIKFATDTTQTDDGYYYVVDVQIQAL